MLQLSLSMQLDPQAYAELHSLRVIDERGVYRCATVHEILSAARAAIELEVPPLTPMDKPGIVKDYFRTKLAGYTHEVFAIIFLDSQHRMIRYEEASHGTLTQASVYPREVIRKALAWNAAALLISHNHPSGIAEPSEADLALTRHLKSALALLDIRLIDHIIVAGDKTMSFAERGQL